LKGRSMLYNKAANLNNSANTVIQMKLSKKL